MGSPPPATPEFASIDDPKMAYLLELYKIVHETQRYEGDGIWARFNILLTVNIVLLGMVTFVFNDHPESANALLLTLCACGALLSLWAIYVLRRLWLWHVHWKDTLHVIEARFPVGLPKILTVRPAKLHKSTAWYQSWLLAYTQPFMLIIFSLWVALAVLTATGHLHVGGISNNSGKHHAKGPSR